MEFVNQRQRLLFFEQTQSLRRSPCNPDHAAQPRPQSRRQQGHMESKGSAKGHQHPKKPPAREQFPTKPQPNELLELCTGRNEVCQTHKLCVQHVGSSINLQAQLHKPQQTSWQLAGMRCEQEASTSTTLVPSNSINPAAAAATAPPAPCSPSSCSSRVLL